MPQFDATGLGAEGENPRGLGPSLAVYGGATVSPTCGNHSTRGRPMFHKTTIAALPALTAISLLAVGCRDAVSPSPHGLGAPAFATTAGAGIALGQQNGAFGDAVPWGNGGTHLGKGFDPRNPHARAPIVAAVFRLA